MTAGSELIIQCDWNAALSEIGSKAWVTLKAKGKPSVHGSVTRVNSSTEPSSLKTTEGFKVIDFRGIWMKVCHESLPGLSTVFLAPVRTVDNIHSKSVCSLCVNENKLVVSAGLDGKIVAWDGPAGTVKFNLDGHFGDVYKCRYFPSGEVILTCGSDMRLMVWCAKTGRLAVTFTGHKMAVTDFAIVERGRNIISVSKDGTLKLWNCGDSSCLATVLSHSGTINCCCITDAPSTLQLGPNNSSQPTSEKEVGTKGKIVFMGCEDGTFYCISLFNREKLFRFNVDSAINCIGILGRSPRVVIGCQNGSVILYEISYPDKAQIKMSWSSCESPVLSVLDVSTDGFFMSRTDGSVLYLTPQGNASPILALTGSNCDPVYDLAFDGSQVYACSRDGSVRIYSPSIVLSK